MTDYKNILIATDLSTESVKLIERARSLASDKSKLAMVHVIPPIGFTYSGISSYVPDMLEYEQIEKKIFAAKQEHIKELVEFHKLHDVQWDIEVGKPATVIKDFAEKTNCDLIIIGSHGESGIRALLGSTTRSVMHDAPCDILCVRLFKT